MVLLVMHYKDFTEYPVNSEETSKKKHFSLPGFGVRVVSSFNSRVQRPLTSQSVVSLLRG